MDCGLIKYFLFLPLCWVGETVENESRPTDQTPLNHDSIIYIMIFYRINRSAICDASIDPPPSPFLPPAKWTSH